VKKNFDVISPEDIAHTQTCPGRYVLITFDDGYIDNYEEALGILKSRNVSATFFVATGFIDNPTLPWWDDIAWIVRNTRESVIAGDCFPGPIVLTKMNIEDVIRRILMIYKSLPAACTGQFLDSLAKSAKTGRYAGDEPQRMWMTWDMVRELRAAGMSIGGHTINHPVLARLSAEEQKQEIRGCKARLEQELGEKMRWFSYPVGGRDSFNTDTRNCLIDAGVELAFSYYGGYQGRKDLDCHDIPRVAIESDIDMGHFRSMMSIPQLFS
jgi:hypothetical protein